MSDWYTIRVTLRAFSEGRMVYEIVRRKPRYIARALIMDELTMIKRRKKTEKDFVYGYLVHKSLYFLKKQCLSNILFDCAFCT